MPDDEEVQRTGPVVAADMGRGGRVRDDVCLERNLHGCSMSFGSRLQFLNYSLRLH